MDSDLSTNGIKCKYTHWEIAQAPEPLSHEQSSTPSWWKEQSNVQIRGTESKMSVARDVNVLLRELMASNIAPDTCVAIARMITPDHTKDASTPYMRRLMDAIKRDAPLAELQQIYKEDDILAKTPQHRSICQLNAWFNEKIEIQYSIITPDWCDYICLCESHTLENLDGQWFRIANMSNGRMMPDGRFQYTGTWSIAKILSDKVVRAIGYTSSGQKAQYAWSEPIERLRFTYNHQ